MTKLAGYVLQFGFGVKSPEQFMQSAPPPQPPAGQAAELGMGGVPIPPASPNPTVPQQAEAGMAGFEQGMTL